MKRFNILALDGCIEVDTQGEYVFAKDYDALVAAAGKVAQHHFDTCDEVKFTGPCSCGVADLRALLNEVKP